MKTPQPKLSKSDVLTRMIEIKAILNSYPKFKSRASLLTKVRKHTTFLVKYKSERSLGLLLLEDCENALKKADEILGGMK